MRKICDLLTIKLCTRMSYKMQQSKIFVQMFEWVENHFRQLQ